MMITYNQIKIYIIICTLVSICIYAILSIYVIKNKGDKKVLTNNLPMFFGFYVTFIVAGLFVYFGLGIAYSVAFQGVNVEGGTKSFAIIFGIFYAYFPISLVFSQLKRVIYNVSMSCIRNHN